MFVWVTAIVLGSAAFVHSVDPGNRLRATPAYGYGAVTSALETGRSVHYYASLSRCMQTSGPPMPELTAPFGGNVDYFRSFTGQFTDTHFMETRLAMNSTGRWVQVSRRVELHPNTVNATVNNTATVHSYVFTPDFFFLTYEYSHTCSLATQMEMGAIQFYEGGPLTQITSFTNLVEHLKTGGPMHFDADVSQCTVTPPSPRPGRITSHLGAHIREFDIRSTGAMETIDASIQPTVGYSRGGDEYALHLHDIHVSSDGNVIIRRTEASPPDLRPRDVETYACRMATTTGGSVKFYTAM